ncbi:tyrosine-protein phosphatase non-receptor type substrate 1-like [Grus japonensis]|uniref:Tyrosine-protein phosphatase non-receptor type substrate 1-like n=1 Tax=Grus japonensis TaxID=30415 RepID=A0ABC9XWV8_GRUJA
MVGVTGEGRRTVVGVTSGEGWVTMVGVTSGEGWVTMVGGNSKGCKMVVGSTSGEGWVTMVGLTSGEGCKMVVGSTSGEGLDNPNLSNIFLYVLPPNMADLYITRNPKVHCLVTNLPSDSGFQLFWIKEKPGLLNPDFLDLQEQFNGTYTATSSLTISTQDWEAGERFTCMVKHEDLLVPLNKSISRRSGKVSPPHVFVLSPNPDEMTQTKVTLTCLVYGFQPENVEVQWLKNQENVPKENYVTTPPLKDGPKESTFFVYSKMVVSKSSWLSGDTYTCMVVHEGLPMRFTQRQAQKVPALDLAAGFCSEDVSSSKELDGLWATVSVFVVLFLLSVCYSATVTLFKVKWLFSTVLHLKQVPGSAHRHALKEPV